MLKPRKRITRQQIKEDKLITFTAKASTFYNQHSRNILAGVGILVVVAVVVAFFINSRAQAEKAATFDLTLAKVEIGQRNYDNASQKLAEIVENYSGTRAAGDALFFLGNLYIDQRNYEQARENFNKYLSRYGSDPQFASSAIAGLGFVDEQEKQYREAAEKYLEAANKYPKEYNAPQYFLNAGRCFALAGEISRAKETYKMILDTYPESDLKQKAENEMNRW
jgi:TolA-binding protein